MDLMELEDLSKRLKKPYGLGLNADFGFPQPMAPQSNLKSPETIVEPIKAVADQTVKAASEKGQLAESAIKEQLNKSKRPSWDEIQKILSSSGDDEMSSKELFGAALIATLPSLVGGLVGGLGGAAGASQGGVAGTQYYLDSRKAQAKEKKENKLKEVEYKYKLADAEADDAYKQAKLIFDRYNAEVQLLGKATDQTTRALQEILKMQSQQEFKNQDREDTQAYQSEEKEKERSFQAEQKGKDRALKAKKGGVGVNAEYIPGWNWDGKTPIDKTEVRMMRTAVADATTLESLLKDLKKTVSAASKAELANPASATSKKVANLLRDAQLLYKGEAFAKLGVLAGPDMQILEDVIENPGSISNLLGDKGKLAQRYDDAISRVNNRLRNTLRTRGFSKPEQASVKVKVSNGKQTFMIDRSDLAEAEKDGFREVQ